MWGEAQAELQEAVKNPVGANQHKSGGSPHRGEADPTVAINGHPKDRKSKEINRHGVPTDPTLGASSKPTDRKSRLVRTLSADE